MVTSPPPQDGEVLQSACVFVCLSVRSHILKPNFLQMLPVAVARSSSDGNAICYVLPVLWMTSCFRVMERMDQNKRRRLFRRVRQVATLKEKLLSTIVGLFILRITFTQT